MKNLFAAYAYYFTFYFFGFIVNKVRVFGGGAGRVSSMA